MQRCIQSARSSHRVISALILLSRAPMGRKKKKSTANDYSTRVQFVQVYNLSEKEKKVPEVGVPLCDSEVTRPISLFRSVQQRAAGSMVRHFQGRLLLAVLWISPWMVKRSPLKWPPKESVSKAFCLSVIISIYWWFGQMYWLKVEAKTLINVPICLMLRVQSSFSALIMQALNLGILWVRDRYSVSEKTASAGSGRWPRVKISISWLSKLRRRIWTLWLQWCKSYAHKHPEAHMRL